MVVEQGYSGLYFRPCRRSTTEWGVEFFPILLAQGPGGQATMLTGRSLPSQKECICALNYLPSCCRQVVEINSCLKYIRDSHENLGWKRGSLALLYLCAPCIVRIPLTSQTSHHTSDQEIGHVHSETKRHRLILLVLSPLEAVVGPAALVTSPRLATYSIPRAFLKGCKP